MTMPASRAKFISHLRLCIREQNPEAAFSGQERAFSLTLLQCLPKGRKIDLIVRQATEAGVARIVPLLSEHCKRVRENARS